MKNNLKILIAAAELTPLAKVGGLADVVGALPKALVNLGVDARIIIPFHGLIDRNKYRSKLIKNNPIVVIGKIDKREEEKSLIADQVFTLKEAQKQLFNSSEEKFDFTITIPKSIRSQVLITLNSLLQKNPGDKKGALILQYHDENKTLKLNSGVNYTANLAKKIEDLLKPKL